MRILYYFKENSTVMYQWQRIHIFSELLRHRIHIEVFNPLLQNSTEEANINIIHILKKERYDLFMTPHNELDLYITTLKQIKKMSIPTLLICFDNLVVPFFHKQICRYFDLVWLTSKETESFFHNWNAKTIVQPYAANPFCYNNKCTKEIERISFVGTPYGSRVNMINLLVQNDIDIDIYADINRSAKDTGSLYKKLIPAKDLLRFHIGRKILIGALKQKLISKERLEKENLFLHKYPSTGIIEAGDIYSGHALALSSSAARNTGVLETPVHIINLRSFEIPMSGGLQICGFFEELAGYFKEDKEIIFYKTDEELLEKAKFYLKPEMAHKRQKMKSAAKKRAEQEHTWYCRFSKVFENLNIEQMVSTDE